jgi:hypothetical protein
LHFNHNVGYKKETPTSKKQVLIFDFAKLTKVTEMKLNIQFQEELMGNI